MSLLLRRAFIVLILLSSAGSGLARPLVFLGDKDLRPYEFLDNGVPRGANVELALAVGRELGRPVDVRLTDWEEAQERLLAGEGDALTLLARTDEREKLYAFTRPTTPVAFALFVRGEDNHRFVGQSLAGKTIGVTQGGLARRHLQASHPEARYVIVGSVLDGMQRLVRREIDAMAAQEWSAYHLLNELGIRGIVGLDPFLRTSGSMAVRQADAALAAELDAALQRVRASGEFDRILDRWSHTRVHLVSERMVTTLGLVGITTLVIVALLVAMLLWQRRQGRMLANEVERRRVLEQDLRRSRSTLEEADRLKDQFLATLAHELRNPLAPILHATRIIELRGGESPDVVRARGIIDRQMRHLTHLVDDLLDVGRIKTGKLELRRAPAELGPIVEDAVQASQHLMAAGGHRLQCDVPRLWLDCDRLRIAQVLGNLLANAAKYNDQPTVIRIDARQRDGWVAITVADDGVGIRPESMESVFEIFHQERQTASAGADGLGIGLWLSRRLAELHGGQLTVGAGDGGHGAVFTLTVPAAARPPAPPAVDVPRARVPRRVLVVDDNVDAAETLAMMLQLDGHAVSVAHTGLQAVETAQSAQPEIVFLDIGLPDIDGLEVCRRLRRSPGLSAMTLVALTGWGTSDDVARATAAGFDGHLTKPVGADAIERWLARPPAAGAGSRRPLADEAAL